MVPIIICEFYKAKMLQCKEPEIKLKKNMYSLELQSWFTHICSLGLDCNMDTSLLKAKEFAITLLSSILQSFRHKDIAQKC